MTQKTLFSIELHGVQHSRGKQMQRKKKIKLALILHNPNTVHTFPSNDVDTPRNISHHERCCLRRTRTTQPKKPVGIFKLNSISLQINLCLLEFYFHILFFFENPPLALHLERLKRHPAEPARFYLQKTFLSGRLKASPILYEARKKRDFIN